MMPDPTPPGSVVDAEAIRREREINEARGIIREVHVFCARSCPHRTRCPGMECRQYRREMAAKDVIARHAPVEGDLPVGPGDVFLEPTIR